MNERKSSAKKDERTRNWSFIVYPESAPANWRNILDAEHIEWIESPLHDKDKLEDGSGELKKPHWHIVVLYEGKKSFEQIKILTDSVNAPIPQKVANVKGLVRYMVHMDNSDKYQYSLSEIVAHGGADISILLKPTNTSRYLLIGEMMDYVRNNNITEMEDLLYYARTDRFNDWFPLLCDNSAYIMGSMIKSRRHRFEKTVQVIQVDKDGEVNE